MDIQINYYIPDKSCQDFCSEFLYTLTRCLLVLVVVVVVVVVSVLCLSNSTLLAVSLRLPRSVVVSL